MSSEDSSPSVIAVDNGSLAGALPRSDTTLSVLSYNVLLPNSVDGWWMFKMYSPLQPVLVSEAETSWAHRSKLLSQQIEAADCDVVCLQETAAVSFDSDWSFMVDLGYLQHELYKKGRFRPATFWRPDRCELAGNVQHRDRCLVTPLRLRAAPTAPTTTSTTAVAYVVNCHLTAGPEATRRVRQVGDALESVRKDFHAAVKQRQQERAKLEQAARKQKSKANKRNDKNSTAATTATTTTDLVPHEVGRSSGGGGGSPELVPQTPPSSSSSSSLLSTSRKEAEPSPSFGACSAEPPPPPSGAGAAATPPGAPSSPPSSTSPASSSEAGVGPDRCVVVVVGDMNGDGGPSSNGVAALLERGAVTPELREGGVQVTTKTKNQNLGVFVDAYVYAASSAREERAATAEPLGDTGSGGDTNSSDPGDSSAAAAPTPPPPPPPPTMVCEELIPRLLAVGQEEGGHPANGFLSSLRSVFESFAKHQNPSSAEEKACLEQQVQQEQGKKQGQGKEQGKEPDPHSSPFAVPPPPLRLSCQGGLVRGLPLVCRSLTSPAEFTDLVLPLRQRVLWPHKPVEECLVPGDDHKPVEECLVLGDGHGVVVVGSGSSSSSSSRTLLRQPSSSPSSPSPPPSSSPSLSSPPPPQAAAAAAAAPAAAPAPAPTAPTAAAATHLGLFEGFDDALVGVLSLYPTKTARRGAQNGGDSNGDSSGIANTSSASTHSGSSSSSGGGGEWSVQLRKFAVEPWAQGRGFGSKMLAEAMRRAPAVAAQAIAEAAQAEAPAAAAATAPTTKAADTPPPPAAAPTATSASPPPPPRPPSRGSSSSVLLWLDAREEQQGFYARHGFELVPAPAAQAPAESAAAAEAVTDSPSQSLVTSSSSSSSSVFYKKGRPYVRMQCWCGDDDAPPPPPPLAKTRGGSEEIGDPSNPIDAEPRAQIDGQGEEEGGAFNRKEEARKVFRNKRLAAAASAPAGGAGAATTTTTGTVTAATTGEGDANASAAGSASEGGGNGDAVVVGSCDAVCMDKGAVVKWLKTINKQVGRGSEFRSAATRMGWEAFPDESTQETSPQKTVAGKSGEGASGASQGEADAPDAAAPAAAASHPRSEADLPDDGVLTWQDFRAIYEDEVRHGKYWGVAYDLAACGHPLPVHPRGNGGDNDNDDDPHAVNNGHDGGGGAGGNAAAEAAPPPPPLRFTARYDRAFVASCSAAAGFGDQPAAAAAKKRKSAPAVALAAAPAVNARDDLSAEEEKQRAAAERQQQQQQRQLEASRRCVAAVRATLSESEARDLPLLPNANHPSDHLPIAISVHLGDC